MLRPCMHCGMMLFDLPTRVVDSGWYHMHPGGDDHEGQPMMEVDDLTWNRVKTERATNPGSAHLFQ